MLKPFFCFYGGKWRAAPRYPKPEHGTIIEPFAGAAGYATRHHDRKVILVERDPVLASLWRYLIHASSSEIMSIPLIRNDQSVADLAICEEAKTLVGFWLNKGTSAPCKTPSKWMRDGLRPNSFWGEAIRTRIAFQVEHIKHWTLIEGSYEQAPDVDATWFVDPPYQIAGSHYRCSASSINFLGLSAWVKKRTGLTVVCENEGAEWLPFEPFIEIKANEGKHGGKKSREAIYVQRRLASVSEDAA
jgi:hypothetical protein